MRERTLHAEYEDRSEHGAESEARHAALRAFDEEACARAEHDTGCQRIGDTEERRAADTPNGQRKSADAGGKSRDSCGSEDVQRREHPPAHDQWSGAFASGKLRGRVEIAHLKLADLDRFFCHDTTLPRP
jgi:hypothetical protein